MDDDVLLTPAQVRSLAVVVQNHPVSDLLIYPPISGAIGVWAVQDDEFFIINADGTPALEGMAA